MNPILTVNYDYFYDRFRKTGNHHRPALRCDFAVWKIKICGGYGTTTSLFLRVELDPVSGPREGDKIRNFILMGLPSKEQEDYYEKYWNKIEVCTKYDVSAFIRDYLSVKQQAIPQQKKIYINFKDFVELGKIETEPLLAEMLAYAKRYQILLDGNSGVLPFDLH